MGGAIRPIDRAVQVSMSDSYPHLPPGHPPIPSRKTGLLLLNLGTPEATDYFTARRTAFTEAMGPYHAAVDKIAAAAKGRSYAATEPVFDDMAAALGLVDRTPDGYRRAATAESDPSPGDLSAFYTLLNNHGVDVLIYNSQTAGALPDKLRDTAAAADVPVVAVTETVAPGSGSFQDWQLRQLTALAGALGVKR